MGNDTIETDSRAADTGGAAASPVQLTILAGADDTLCIDELCVATDARATAPSPEVTP